MVELDDEVTLIHSTIHEERPSLRYNTYFTVSYNNGGVEDGNIYIDV